MPWVERYEDDDSLVVWEPLDGRPEDAHRIGLTRHVPDGALLDFAGNLDSSKPLHRMTAWVMLVVFCFPVAMYVLRILWAVWR